MNRKNKIITKLYNEGLVQTLVQKYSDDLLPQDLEDITQDIFVYICELSEEKIERLFDDNVLNFYVVKIIKNQMKSKTSAVYKNYRKFNKIYMEFKEEIYNEEL
jgi:hypothetical protein